MGCLNIEFEEGFLVNVSIVLNMPTKLTSYKENVDELLRLVLCITGVNPFH